MKELAGVYKKYQKVYHPVKCKNKSSERKTIHRGKVFLQFLLRKFPKTPGKTFVVRQLSVNSKDSTKDVSLYFSRNL